MNEDDGIVSGQHNIGFARKVFDMDAETETLPVEVGTHEQLSLCVFALDAAHVVAAGFAVVDISHRDVS